MTAAIVQMQNAVGAGPTLASAEAGFCYSREDTLTGTTPVVRPTAIGTTFSWLKWLALVVTTIGTTTISNRRIQLSTTETAGLAVFFAGVGAYVQAAGGNLPTASGSNGPTTPVGPTVATIIAIAAGANPSIQTSAAHNLVAGQAITITLVLGAIEVNGNWTVLAVVDSTHFTITLAAHTAYTSGGTVTATFARASTAPAMYDPTPVVSSSLGRNGLWCQTCMGVDFNFTGGAGSATAVPDVRLLYDDA